jgi:hypothetical protein
MPRARVRDRSPFRTKLDGAIKNVTASIRLFSQDSGKALGGLVVTSNAALFNATPADPGVAVWFVWDGALFCIPVDRFPAVADNLQAIHHIIEARRVELRYAGVALVRRSFQGFLSLPAPDDATAWWRVLGVARDASPDAIREAWKALVVKTPEDQRGPLNVARDAGLRERGQA